jgi:hypothetical protein
VGPPAWHVFDRVAAAGTSPAGVSVEPDGHVIGVDLIDQSQPPGGMRLRRIAPGGSVVWTLTKEPSQDGGFGPRSVDADDRGRFAVLAYFQGQTSAYVVRVYDPG